MAIQGDTVEIKSDWCQPSDVYGWIAVLRNVLPLFAFISLVPFLADHNVYIPWLLCPLVGLFAYRVTVVMHDCTHHTLFQSRRLNQIIGLVLGAMSGIEFHSFSEQHWRHHQLYGKCGDPQGFQYANLKNMSASAFGWHLVKPLLGFNLHVTFPESFLAPKNAARLIKNGEFTVVIVVQLIVLILVTGFGRHLWLAAFPLVSAATFGLFFSQLRGIAEHGIVDVAADTRYVRSHTSNWLDRIVLYDINFNYHKEHHNYPQIPSCHLPAMSAATNNLPSPRSMLSTINTLYSKARRLHAET